MLAKIKVSGLDWAVAERYSVTQYRPGIMVANIFTAIGGEGLAKPYVLKEGVFKAVTELSDEDIGKVVRGKKPTYFKLGKDSMYIPCELKVYFTTDGEFLKDKSSVTYYRPSVVAPINGDVLSLDVFRGGPLMTVNLVANHVMGRVAAAFLGDRVKFIKSRG